MSDYCNGCEQQCDYGSVYYGCGVGYVPTLNGKKITEYTNVYGIKKNVEEIYDANYATQIAKHLAAMCPKHCKNKVR